ncbi:MULTISPECIES: endo-1,4-beta-xylanase [unclassified Arcicella]|uniref:endo-1,4-beta-xylanase n=1 Tax=unclassified Arcicella TaxID=2644986 RepID=UPI00285ECFA4|nr:MULTISPECIES: endo-1,4-beta-xylanase [unclassified Arcicella]MDR6562306.1 GH35 family endo-1,4-beta-xylanase [Arcicella sp. BE51]MDR6811999.1 GH35 family endo-1,4-beta-xylanase [Arcicella sp. BE140]MDR6823310.1 GH35 family endo-1,4-beta-xylanase [Arcicella sp. BE139]
MNKIIVKVFLAILATVVQIFHTNAQSKKGFSLLVNDTLLFKPTSKYGAILELASVSDQPFSKAYRISTVNQSGNDSFVLRYGIDSTVRKGDVILLSFYSRSIQSKRETGESFMEIALDRFVGGKYNWPPLFERGISFGSKWILTQIPFIAGRDVDKGEMALMIKSGKFPQVFEIGGISLINYKQSVKIQDLPKSIVHYDGDAPNAAWRKTAEERIDKYRKGDLTIRVIDKAGKPIPQADVTVTLNKIAFGWGTATSSAMILDTISPNAQKYRDTLLRYFNKVVLENEMKARNWYRFNQAQTQKGVKWFRDHDIPVRGHVMVWPSWEHSPHLANLKNDKATLNATILKQIDQQTTAMKDQFVEWDVVNEPYAHHNIMDTLGGKKMMVEWFKAASKNTKGVKLFLNDYTMFHSEGVGSDSFYNNIKFLKENLAPIDAIGEQGHIGGTPPGIEFIIAKLDHFATLGLPIQITEFDITSDDDDFKARYLKDFMTAVFSHPSTIGLIQWGFWENAHWIPAGALWDKNWNIRPHGKVFTELVSKTWNTNENGKTNKNGVYTIRGFNGAYNITVKHRGKSIKQPFSLDSKGGTLVMKMDN